MNSATPARIPKLYAICRSALAGDERRQSVVRHMTDFDVVRVAPDMGRIAKGINLARTFHPKKAVWREQSKRNPYFFEASSRVIDRQLAAMGERDLAITFEAWFTTKFPHVMYEDGTSLMTLNRWPEWVPKTARTSHHQKLESDAYHRALHVFTTSQWVKDSLLADYGLPDAHVTNVGQGHDFKSPAVLSKCEGPLIFVGYEWERKGGPMLLEAFKEVRRSHPHAELSLVGPEIKVDQPGVTCYGKVSDKAKLQSLLMNSAAFVLPSVFDPNPHAAMEAMACGLPVVVSEGCGTKEILKAGATDGGFVVKNQRELVERLSELVGASATSRQAIGENGAVNVARTSSWPLAAQRITDKMRVLCLR